MSASNQVQLVRIEAPQHGQRLDNFLFRQLKGVPRSRVYRCIRRGEVRINSKRCKPESRLRSGDVVRIPPDERAAEPDTPPKPGAGLAALLENSILHEDGDLLVINKPAGLAVHGGSGIRLGLIEAMRQLAPRWQHLELAHRLDRDTSGCLVLCKNMIYLKDLQAQLRNRTVQKEYWALVHGHWPDDLQEIAAPLRKNTLSSGERMVIVAADGKPSRTRYRVARRLAGATLLIATPETGRTHQIRVHCQQAGHTIVGDRKYQAGRSCGAGLLQRYRHLCLHARGMVFRNPGSGERVQVEAALDERFTRLLNVLNA